MLPTVSSGSRSRVKFWVILAVILVALIAIYAFFHRTSAPEPNGMQAPPARMGRGGHGGPGRFAGGGPVPVQVGVATSQDVPIYLNALGTVIANQTVTVTSQVSGQLMSVNFTEGQQVKAGQVLAQIDPRTYQATLEQYQGALKQNQALLKNAQLTLDRYQKLYAQDSLARQDLETQMATVGQYAGAVQTDQAQIDAAKLNLQYARITAPISGRVGLRQVDPGNVISTSSSTGIVTITQTQPIAVTFSVPQSNLPVLLQALHHGQFLPVTAFDQDNKNSLDEGKLQFISNEIDTTTGTVKLKAMFNNPQETLYPNQFVNVRLQTGTLANATVVPSAALQLSADGDFIFVVKEDDTVVRQAVKTGPALGSDRVAILSGVTPGERVVTVGVDRLNTGSKIQVVTPATDTAPADTTKGKTGKQAGAHKIGQAKDSEAK